MIGPGEVTFEVCRPAAGGAVRVAVTATWPTHLGNEAVVAAAVVEAARLTIDRVLAAEGAGAARAG